LYPWVSGVRVENENAVGGEGGAPYQREDGEAVEPRRLRVGRIVYMREAVWGCGRANTQSIDMWRRLDATKALRDAVICHADSERRKQTDCVLRSDTT